VKERGLSFWEASATIMGAGVGGGIMAVPFLASRSGYLSFVAILLLAYGLNLLIHLMLVEVLFRHGDNVQLVELIRTYVFRGAVGAVLIWLFFLILVLAFISSLTAYISGAGEILASLTGLPPLAARLVVYAMAAGVVFFGLKMVGIAEKLSLYGIGILMAVLVIASFRVPAGLRPLLAGGGREILALYGMVMYSLFAFFAVPQAVQGLAGDKTRTIRAVVTGLGLNCLLVFLLTTIAMAVSREVTEVAIIGIGRAIGPTAQVAGSLFILLAMLTTYWSVSLALADMIGERTGIQRRFSWLIATGPTLVLIVVGRLDFLDYLKIAGGATALMVVLITLPLYINARKLGPVSSPSWTLGAWGRPAVLAVLFVMVVLVAVGSLLGVGM
jgi:amino acid permease